MNAVTFATTFVKQFHAVTTGLLPNEIPLFKALSDTVKALSTQFDVKEYHGGSHQVTFSASPSLSRSEPRCELADLMIVTYRTRPLVSIRVTYLQAKSERTFPKRRLCHTSYEFSGNVEQWCLLAEKPSVYGCGGFNPPSDLLSGALLDSIGTFGVFYREDPASPYDMFYSVASNLSPANRGNRYSKLSSKSPCYSRQIRDGYEETVIAGCLEYFAHDLACNLIGSPIEQDTNASDSQWRSKMRAWLRGYLREKEEGSSEDDRNGGLLGLLEAVEENPTDWVASQTMGVKSVILFDTTGLDDRSSYKEME